MIYVRNELGFPGAAAGSSLRGAEGDAAILPLRWIAALRSQ
jgi:hypothetical protein